jgi:CRISPR-associated Cas5-like protein
MARQFARFAKVAYTFVLMNYAAVVGLFAAARGRKVWR